mmetsp:Transcript_107146/g.308291  ORF Transcript_107146/g.308291 Transcript_107146/m.308291 type:complete len:250 (-) Transcript_107146:102-851(-)
MVGQPSSAGFTATLARVCNTTPRAAGGQDNKGIMSPAARAHARTRLKTFHIHAFVVCGRQLLPLAVAILHAKVLLLLFVLLAPFLARLPPLLGGHGFRPVLLVLGIGVREEPQLRMHHGLRGAADAEVAHEYGHVQASWVLLAEDTPFGQPLSDLAEVHRHEDLVVGEVARETQLFHQGLGDLLLVPQSQLQQEEQLLAHVKGRFWRVVFVEGRVFVEGLHVEAVLALVELVILRTTVHQRPCRHGRWR